MFAYVAAVYWDMPYGITQEAWDVLQSPKDFTKVLKQVAALQKSTSWVFFVWCNPVVVGELTKCFKDNGYGDTQMFYWVKPNHNTMTRVSSLTSSVENGILASYPHSGAVNWNVSLSSRERSNYTILPSVTTLSKNAMNNPVNPCQKPPLLSKFILEMNCMPSETVLVLGSGAMGDVKGAVLAGLNVIGIENDREQYIASEKIMLDFKTELKEQAVSKLSQPFASQSSSSSVVDQNVTIVEDSQPDDNSNKVTIVKVNCVHCGNDIPIIESDYGCASSTCAANPSFRYHKACTVMYKNERYCNDCFTQAMEFVNESQVDTQLAESMTF